MLHNKTETAKNFHANYISEGLTSIHDKITGYDAWEIINTFLVTEKQGNRKKNLPFPQLTLILHPDRKTKATLQVKSGEEDQKVNCIPYYVDFFPCPLNGKTAI